MTVPITVCLGYRDWKIDHLSNCIESIRRQTIGGLPVIVCDYGSRRDQTALVRLSEELGFKLCREEANGSWNRSRALNLALQCARTKFVATTDADIVFSPDFFKSAMEAIENRPLPPLILSEALDLPEGLPVPFPLDVDRLRTIAIPRKRWGQGGIQIFPRELVFSIRGYDEEYEVWGAEDNDMADRAQRLEIEWLWIEDRFPKARIFHQWHPPTDLEIAKDADLNEFVRSNRRRYQSVKTQIRNPNGWGRIMTIREMNELLDDHPRLRPMLEYVELPSCLDKTVLDIGPARGWWSIMAMEQGAKSVVAIDIDPYWLSEFERFVYAGPDEDRRRQRIRLVELNAYNLHSASFPEVPWGFDVVFCMSIYHHVADVDRLFQKVRSVVARNGICVIQGPYREDRTIYEEHERWRGKPLAEGGAENTAWYWVPTLSDLQDKVKCYFKKIEKLSLSKSDSRVSIWARP